MVRDEPIQMCPSCPHPQSGHLKSSGACFIQDCMCGWEMKNGQKNPSHPMYDGRSFQPKPEAAFWKKPHVIPSPAPAVIRPPSKKSHERLFPGQPCFYCGAASESVDHLLPRSRGGKEGDNLVPACQRCNQMKANMTLEEFLEHCQKVIQTVLSKKVIQAGDRLWRAVG